VASETQDLLARCPVYAGLPEAVLAAVAGEGELRRFERHQVLFHQGDAADEFIVVLDGRLKLTQVGADGDEVIVRYVGPGEMCAVVALFPDQAYPVTGEAADELRVIAWRRPVIDALMLAHPRLALNAMRLLSERMRELSERLREIATEKVARRVARALLRLARKAGRRSERGVEIDMPLTREDIAKLAGTTLFTVSRLLSEWESAGIVESGRERVVIRFPHGLVAIAEDLPRE